MTERDVSVMKHIDKYCTQINETISLFGRDYEVFTASHPFQNACCMCILQIGELTAALSDDFKNRHTAIPWRQIKGLRNIVAHAYGTIEPDIVWEIINAEIPQLQDFCHMILKTEDERNV